MKFIFFMVGLLLLASCVANDQCKMEKEVYIHDWNGIVKEIGRYKKYKATYYIKTNSGTFFVGMNELVMYGKVGDSIVKPKSSFLVDVYRNGKIEFTSRVISETCDTIVDSNNKLQTYEELKEKHPNLINWK